LLLTLIRGPSSHQDTPPNARAIAKSLGPRTLISSMMEMLPSSRQRRGDRRLREAREITAENESIISEEDRKVIGEKIES